MNLRLVQNTLNEGFVFEGAQGLHDGSLLKVEENRRDEK